MKTQLKKWGNSLVFVADPNFIKFHDAKEGDWFDLSDAIKLNKEEKQ